MENSDIPTQSISLEEAIANLQQTDDPDLRYYAAWWLGRFRVQQPEVVDLLIGALSDEDSRSPDGGYPLRRNAARALGKLDDQRAVAPLIDCLTCEDYYVRGAAIESLGELGDTVAIAPLLKLLEGGVEAATMMPGKPHLRQPYDLLLEALGSLGAVTAIAEIQPFLNHFAEKVQYAAARSLYQLTGESQYGDVLVRALDAPDLQLRRAALMDIGAVGYLPGAKAIANTLAENSLKLIALKGLLETHLENLDLENLGLENLGLENLDSENLDQHHSNCDPTTLAAKAMAKPLSPEAIQVMDLMDGLL